MNVDFVQVTKDGKTQFALKITLRADKQHLMNERLFGGFSIAEQLEHDMAEPRYLNNYGWQNEIYWFSLTVSGQDSNDLLHRYILLPDNIAELIEPGLYTIQFGGLNHYSFRRFRTTIQDFETIQWKVHSTTTATPKRPLAAQTPQVASVSEQIHSEETNSGQIGSEQINSGQVATTSAAANNTATNNTVDSTVADNKTATPNTSVEIPTVIEDAPTDASDKSASRRSPLPLLLGAIVVIAAGAGAWFFLQPADKTVKPAVTQSPKPTTPKPITNTTNKASNTVNTSAEASTQQQTTSTVSTSSASTSPASASPVSTSVVSEPTVSEPSKTQAIPAVALPNINLTLAADKMQVSYQSSDGITIQSCDNTQVEIQSNQLLYHRLPGVQGRESFACRVQQNGIDNRQTVHLTVQPMALTLSSPSANDDRVDLLDWLSQKTDLHAQEVFCPDLRFSDNLRLNGHYLVYKMDNPSELKAFSCNFIMKDSSFSLKITPEMP